MENLVIIYNSIPPYGFDTLPILGLPTGAHYKARFPTKYLVPEHIDTFANWRHGRMQAGYLVFRDYASGRLFPVRKATVFSVRKEGGVYYFDYCLGEYFDYSSNAETVRKDAENFGSALADEQEGVHLLGNEEIQTYVLGTSLFPDITSDNQNGQTKAEDLDSNRWGNSVRAVAQCEIFHDTPFFAVSVFDEDAPAAIDKDGYFKLQSNKLYTLKFTHMVRSGRSGVTKNGPYFRNSEYLSTSPYTLNLEYDSEVLSLSNSSFGLVGQNDRVNTSIFVKPSFSDVFTSLVLKTPRDKKAVRRFVPNTLELKLKILKQGTLLKDLAWLLASVMYLILVRGIMYFYSLDVVDGSSSIWIVLGGYLLQTAGVVAITLRAAMLLERFRSKHR